MAKPLLTRARQAALPTILVLTLGCDERARAPVTPDAPSQGERLNGVVFDSALRPLAGALVSIVDGPVAGRSTTTDATGQFSLVATFDTTTRFSASKPGHVTRTGTLQPYCDSCNPAWWIYFYLEPLASPANLAGDYMLTLTADSVCGSLPEEVRSRTYTASIAASPIYPPNSTFELTVTGAPFLKGYERFSIHVAGDFVAIPIGDSHGSPGFVEQVAVNTYIAFGGSTTGVVETNASTISMSLDGSVEYCARKSAMGSVYDCRPEQAIASTFCIAKNHRLVLTRR